MPNITKNIIEAFKAKNKRKGVSLGAATGKVVIMHTDGNIILTPALARKIAEALPAMAEIAERGFHALETPS